MKNIRKMTAVAMLMGILMVGTSFGQKGLIVSDFAGTKDNPCTQQTGKDGKGVILQDFTGILVNGATGILVNGFTGILVNGATGILVNGATGTPVNCGILVNG